MRHDSRASRRAAVMGSWRVGRALDSPMASVWRRPVSQVGCDVDAPGARWTLTGELSPRGWATRSCGTRSGSRPTSATATSAWPTRSASTAWSWTPADCPTSPPRPSGGRGSARSASAARPRRRRTRWATGARRSGWSGRAPIAGSRAATAAASSARSGSAGRTRREFAGATWPSGWPSSAAGSTAGARPDCCCMSGRVPALRQHARDQPLSARHAPDPRPARRGAGAPGGGRRREIGLTIGLSSAPGRRPARAGGERDDCQACLSPAVGWRLCPMAGGEIRQGH